MSELSSRCGFNQSPVMFEGGARRFAQSYSMSDLTYLGLYTTSYARDNKVNLEPLPGLKDLKDTEAPALPDDMTVRFDDDGDSPFTLYTPKGNFDLARHARPTATEATEPVVYPYYHARRTPPKRFLMKNGNGAGSGRVCKSSKRRGPPSTPR